MTTHSTNDSGIKSGSSVPGDSILVHRKLLWTAQQKYLRKHFTEYQDKAKNFFTEGELREAGKIYSGLKNGWRKASVKLGGDFAKMEDAKDSSREELSSALGYALPNYRKFRNLQKDYSREHRNMVESVFEIPAGERAHFDWGDIAVTSNPEAQEFGAPFPEFDVHHLYPDIFITRQDSYVLPESGDIVVDVAMDADGCGNWNPPWGFPLYTWNGTFASCGVPFTLPRAGRLKIGAVLQNLVCRGGDSVTDCFGFSGADLTYYVAIFVDIVRADGNVLHSLTYVAKSGLVSHGADLVGYTIPDLDKVTPYTIGVVTELPFPSGEFVRILVGTEVYCHAVLDDMACHFDATVWFKLKKIVLEVI